MVKSKNSGCLKMMKYCKLKTGKFPYVICTLMCIMSSDFPLLISFTLEVRFYINDQVGGQQLPVDDEVMQAVFK